MSLPFLDLPLLRTRWRAFRALVALSPAEVDAFLASYALFAGDPDTAAFDFDARVVDYYRVLNHLCALGNVEKMYIPPHIDPAAGVRGNQVLFERRMMADAGIRPGARVLDLGCGRGRVAAHVATHAGAHVTGINIDPGQLESAEEHASTRGLSGRLSFVRSSLNRPLPFPDAAFDAAYQIQAFTYARDKPGVLAEVRRVLRPGARFSFLDWVRLPAFDPQDPEHRDLLARTKSLIGAVDTPSPEELCAAMRAAGLEVVHSADASVDGHQSQLIAAEDGYYRAAAKLVHALVSARLLPRHFRVLIDRFVSDGDAFIAMDRRGLATTSWHIVASRPLHG